MPRRRREFPGVTAYTDRHGARRFRYRGNGLSVELGRDYGSQEFVRRYKAARQGRKLDDVKGEAHGSLGWLIASYYRSPEYRRLAERTQYVQRNVIEKLREQHGHRPAATLDAAAVRKLMSKKADTPHAANYLLRMLRALMGHAINLGIRTADPTRDVKKYAEAGGDGFHTWDEGEIAQFMATHPPGSPARLAFALMLYVAAARVDATRLGWQNVKDGRIGYRREKTRKKTPVLVDVPIHPELAAELERLPPGRMTFLETCQGRARSSNGLGNAMRRWCDQAGLSECTSHGLRKACARRLAEAGATPSMIAAVTGHTTLKEVSRYTAAADRSGLAEKAMDRLGAATPNRPVVANHPSRFVSSAANPLQEKGHDGRMVPRGGFEPPTREFSVRCSTN